MQIRRFTRLSALSHPAPDMMIITRFILGLWHLLIICAFPLLQQHDEACVCVCAAVWGGSWWMTVFGGSGYWWIRQTSAVQSFTGASGNFPLLVFPVQVIHGEGVKGCVSVSHCMCMCVFEQLFYCWAVNKSTSQQELILLFGSLLAQHKLSSAFMFFVLFRQALP